MERWQNRVAVVTGASCGIGKAIADDLVKAGLRVVGLARRYDRMTENRARLPEALQSRYFIRKCDISVESEVKQAFDWVEHSLGGTDILINNAGIVRPGNIVDMDSQMIDEVFNTNVKGLIYCSQAAFKSMSDRKFAGHIVHINSILGHNVLGGTPEAPSLNVYPPSKYAVTAINETLRNELRVLGTKIKTTSISPGITKTEIAPPELYDLFDALLMPEDVSQAVLFCIATPPHVQIHEMVIKPVGEIV
ncbi:farnesol dehydrogenase-like isoform X3 [Eupeodes corollae]|uniref:farnesol dehydrogenase-like isoform X3 n=1 Tax=Eupeodes corollae TaxID=290404 RepID=UPI00248F9446|nr:farnesol dehydrogenase-like isoform X3 [Eupeodes corollae]